MKLQTPISKASANSQCIALISGLAVGDPTGNPTQLSLMADYLTGMLGTNNEQQAASQVSAHMRTQYVKMYDKAKTEENAAHAIYSKRDYLCVAVRVYSLQCSLAMTSRRPYLCPDMQKRSPN